MKMSSQVMAMKRLCEDAQNIHDKPEGKKMRSLRSFTMSVTVRRRGWFPLEILLVDAHAGKRPQEIIPPLIKVETVVLDGDFPFDECVSWSSVDFNRNIVKERKGKRPLLAGDNVITLKDGAASIHDLKIH
ncbi:hypothetical protein KSP40_PGU015369 [Platanthera guangdongensis]|uniref:Calmodulin binding protein-like N-terminal domain-containing protein n=1 Tax=Platanthera guangdongensis TaxID=2320717 RepID=A0ABR2LDR2_9ASPA